MTVCFLVWTGTKTRTGDRRGCVFVCLSNAAGGRVAMIGIDQA